MKLSRRAFATGLAVTPLVKGAPPANLATSTSTDEKSNDSQWRPLVFDDHQFETVSILVDLIIPPTDTPGARAALVQQHLDRILSQSPESARIKFLEGLWWLDGYSLRLFNKPFKELPLADQTKIVHQLHSSENPDYQSGADFIELAKRWTARIYYSTQIGEQELNKGGRVPTHYYSCS